MNQHVPFDAHASPAHIAGGGERASYRPFESLAFEGQGVADVVRGL